MTIRLRFSTVAAVVLAIVTLVGCSAGIRGMAITYSFEPRVSFAEFKSYQWAEARQTYGQDPLLEANVRFLADRGLEAKGLALKADKADLLIWMGHGYSYGYGDELRTLTLNIARADNNKLVWRGMASGTIRADAASSDLKTAVEGMMANFPPK